ncbi:MAG: DUF3343 domain-containing protein [Firmicutes bacterium]|nr:DUF3343 domain-containing protein [Bacillota bacterium]
MYLVTFHTNFDANLFSRKAKALGKAQMKPVPRQLSSSCGTCVVFQPADGDQMPGELSSLSFEKMYRMNGSEYEMVAEKE